MFDYKVKLYNKNNSENNNDNDYMHGTAYRYSCVSFFWF